MRSRRLPSNYPTASCGFVDDCRGGVTSLVLSVLWRSLGNHPKREPKDLNAPTRGLQSALHVASSRETASLKRVYIQGLSTFSPIRFRAFFEIWASSGGKLSGPAVCCVCFCPCRRCQSLEKSVLLQASCR